LEGPLEALVLLNENKKLVELGRKRRRHWARRSRPVTSKF
jgi:hypothetical protein